MEDQHTEWKATWKDDYLRELCAFANADGGTLWIGINDQGLPVGLANAKRLLEDLPNKIRSKLGIVPELSLLPQNGKTVLRIVVAAQPALVSYNGKFYYRSGSTVQELHGSTLHSMLLSRQGLAWDAVPVPRVAIDDLSDRAFDLFRNKAVASGREQSSFLMESKESILRNLKLMRDGMLTRAAILLFHPDPESYVFGSTIKVGFFRNEADLLFQDMLEGSLMEQLDLLEGMFKIKYLKAYIYYKGFQRIDDYLFPWEGLREAILNAVIHKAYETAIPVSIKVFEDKIYIYNPGHFPAGWTTETLFQEHESSPHNQLLANAFYRCGEIEAWGRGIGKIVNACRDAQIPPPRYADNASVCTFFDGTEKLARLKEVTQSKDDDRKSGTQAEQKLGTQAEQKKRTDNAEKRTEKAGTQTEQKKRTDNAEKRTDNAEKRTDKAGTQTEQKKRTPKGGLKTSTKILEMLRQHPQMTVHALQLSLQINRSVIMKHIANLKQAGRLRRVGPAKGGHWEVLE